MAHPFELVAPHLQPPLGLPKGKLFVAHTVGEFFDGAADT